MSWGLFKDLNGHGSTRKGYVEVIPCDSMYKGEQMETSGSVINFVIPNSRTPDEINSPQRRKERKAV
jgi:hypothetical protein